MPLAPDPFQSFNIGREIGRANSPVTGLGEAIRGILEDAKKKGLLQAQSQFQTEGAKDLAKFKQENAPTGRVFQHGEGELIDVTPEGGATSSDVFGKAPSTGESETITILKGMGLLPNLPTGTTAQSPKSGEDLTSRRIKRANEIEASNPGMSREAIKQRVITEIPE